jgi:hypothetical protein
VADKQESWGFGKMRRLRLENQDLLSIAAGEALRQLEDEGASG